MLFILKCPINKFIQSVQSVELVYSFSIAVQVPLYSGSLLLLSFTNKAFTSWHLCSLFSFLQRCAFSVVLMNLNPDSCCSKCLDMSKGGGYFQLSNADFNANDDLEFSKKRLCKLFNL